MKRGKRLHTRAPRHPAAAAAAIDAAPLGHMTHHSGSQPAAANTGFLLHFAVMCFFLLESQFNVSPIPFVSFSFLAYSIFQNIPASFSS
jgi:hypothetical protein